MKLILIPLFFLILIAITIQMINLQPISTNYNGHYEITGVNANLPLNFGFSIVALTGFITFFASCAILGVIIGLDIDVLGSGIKLSERGQNIAYNCLFYGGLWGIFSVMCTVGINGISLFSLGIWGIFGYLMLTLIYVLGVNNQIQHGLEG